MPQERRRRRPLTAAPLSGAVAQLIAAPAEDAAAALSIGELSDLGVWLNRVRWAQRTASAVDRSENRGVCDGVHHPPGRVIAGICAGCSKKVGGER